MPNHKAILLRLRNAFHGRWVRLLWNSQKKELGEVGDGSMVIDLPRISGAKHVRIGDRFVCGKDVTLEAWEQYGDQQYSPCLEIGNDVTLTDRCHISCIDRVSIGDGVLLGREVYISDNSHGDTSGIMADKLPKRRPLTSKGPVMIGKNVWIGRQVTILSGVTIGDNAIIGANSVVNRDVPANSVAAGNPAKVIKTFHSESGSDDI